MKRIDAIHLEYPFAGARMLRDLLQQRRHQMSAGDTSRTLMAKMGIEALYRKPNTSKQAPARTRCIHTCCVASRSSAPTTSGPPTSPTSRWLQGWVYLCAIVDWASRRVLAHRISITMETDFCLEALHEAFAKHGQPEIFNTDQGSQFTSLDFTSALADRNIRISMDGKGSWRDNVFVERLWRSIKYEEVYLHAYESVSQAKAGIGRSERRTVRARTLFWAWESSWAVTPEDIAEW